MASCELKRYHEGFINIMLFTVSVDLSIKTTHIISRFKSGYTVYIYILKITNQKNQMTSLYSHFYI